MDITELNGGCTPCGLMLNDSTLSFPSMDGLVWVDPSISPDVPGGRIYIEEFIADNKHINTSSLLKPILPGNTRDLAFHLGYPAWVAPDNMSVEYKLEPYLKEWKTLETEHDPVIPFSNLPSGEYHLVVRKLNGFGEGNYSYDQLSFRIQAPWFMQLWAWLMGLFFLLVIVIMIVDLRTQQIKVNQGKLKKQIAERTRELKEKSKELEKTDHMKTRLVSIISHDLVTPLKFLHLAGKNLIEKKDELSTDLHQEAIIEIMNTSKELELLSVNILNWIKYKNEDRRLAKESFNLYQLTDQLFRVFYSLARQKQIRLVNQVDKELALYQFIEPVKIILYNLILNGINFTQEGYILVSSAVTPDGVYINVIDTGVGMTQDQINNVKVDPFIISSANVDNRKGNGLGYLIVKDLLKIIRGKISIRSEKGAGTQITIMLPARHGKQKQA
jgi:signal transduction histidine kinase